MCHCRCLVLRNCKPGNFWFIAGRASCVMRNTLYPISSAMNIRNLLFWLKVKKINQHLWDCQIATSVWLKNGAGFFKESGNCCLLFSNNHVRIFFYLVFSKTMDPSSNIFFDSPWHDLFTLSSFKIKPLFSIFLYI